MKEKNNTKRQMVLRRSIVLFAVIQPLIDLDYLFYDVLDSIGLPRFSTIIRFLILPALVLWTFFEKEEKKKQTFLFAVIYGTLFCAYFWFHSQQAQDLYPRLQLTPNFQFHLWQEFTYVLTLCLPYGYLYCVYQENLLLEDLKWIVTRISALVSISIFLGDLFVFGQSTYYGKTVANFFSWFTDIYEWYHPRTLASKFFFHEGNTIGILLFMILPLMYYFFSIATARKEKVGLRILIAIQSMSMQILATRVATYGAVVIPALFLVLYVIDLWIHKKPIQKNVLLSCVCACALFGLILNSTPAIENQRVDAINDTALLHNNLAAEGMEELSALEDLIPGTAAYINAYVYMFESYGINGRYIQSVPSMYYTEYYDYRTDPKFWTDVTFMPVFDRVSGRQIETIFFNYKYQNLTPQEKWLGMGYSTFMNGSIVLEQDFKQQLYTLGYLGEVLLIVPWLLFVLYGVIQFLRHFKQLWNLENFCLAISLGVGLGSAWLSGHMLDQFLTSIFAALVVGMLLRKVHEVKV